MAAYAQEIMYRRGRKDMVDAVIEMLNSEYVRFERMLLDSDPTQFEDVAHRATLDRILWLKEKVKKL